VINKFYMNKYTGKRLMRKTVDKMGDGKINSD